jgi:hypothetical protein
MQLRYEPSVHPTVEFRAARPNRPGRRHVVLHIISEPLPPSLREIVDGRAALKRSFESEPYQTLIALKITACVRRYA